MGHAGRTPGPPSGIEKTLLEASLRFPEAWEDHPWGERALKVKKKVFCFLSMHTGTLHMSVKLPESWPEALLLPFTEPTGYGLGKSGWVTAKVPTGTAPASLLLGWIEESYRAVAPKALVKQLDGGPARKAPAKKAAKKVAAERTPRKTAVRKKA